MRLFVALNFSEEVKNKIEDITLRVKEHSTQGKFVNKGLMHLTVEFLGEISESNIDLIKEAIDCLESEPFSMILTNIGYFKRNEGDICWLGIEENAKMLNMQSQLHERLLKKGFKLEDREYKPHLTIGRKVKMLDDFNKSKLIFYTLPSPLETAMLIKRSGAVYDEDLLNPVTSVNQYQTNLKMALNLGIYSADLSYASLFDQTQTTIQYIGVAKKLADGLGILQAID